MIVKEVSFTGSFTKLSQCPNEDFHEFAFIGRSNVGKSSLINMLLNKKSIARVSHTPGKTRHINFFKVNAQWFLVDLPGYGYARVSKKERAAFNNRIKSYLADRKQLQTAFLLVDTRIPPQKIDLEFANWMGAKEVPFSIIFTKADKVKSNLARKNTMAFKAELKKQWATLPPIFLTSAHNKLGRDDVLNYIESIVNESM